MKKFDKSEFFEYLKSRKCDVKDYDEYIKAVDELAEKLNAGEMTYITLLYLVGKEKYCVTLGDISNYFGVSKDEIVDMAKKMARKYGLKFEYNIDACIRRALEYCGIRDKDAERTIKELVSILGSGRPDVVIAFSVGLLYGCDVTKLFGTSRSALRYHLYELFGFNKF